MRFWDSSALVPLFVRERHSPLVEALVRDDHAMVVWWAGEPECASAVHRLRRGGMFSTDAAATILSRLAATMSAGNVVQPGDAVRSTALRLLATHPLRAADALQLAAALIWTHGAPAGADFVCLDDRLREAALLEGFRVLPERV